MKLKELLLQIYEGNCERLPDETDEDYLTRCGNDMFNQQFGISQLSNIPNVMKTKILVPNKIEERLRQIDWEKMEDSIKDMQKQCKTIQTTIKGNHKQKELLVQAMAFSITKKLDNLRMDIYDKARNIPPDIK
jgi:hypothetical protein